MKKKIIKKTISGITMAVLAAGLMAGCSGNDSSSQTGNTTKGDNSTQADGADFDTAHAIDVISREDGSGTRGAFVELTGIEEDKVDRTTVDAAITNSTEVMLTTVAGDTYAIGYVSLGSLNDKVKAVKVDGVEATAENVKSGEYTVARPFNIATNGDESDATKDFISYIMSAEGQAIITENGYVAEDEDADSYKTSDITGTVTVSGSTSVGPVMEKIAEAYMAVSEVEVTINTNDSSTGMNDAAAGTSDIGMASRALKDSEIEKGLVATAIAKDGVAVILNPDSTIENLTTEQIMNIYIGEYTTWSEVAK